MDVTHTTVFADRHRQRAADFRALAGQVEDWDAPTPVAEWNARDIVRHLVEWLPGFLGAGSPVRLVPGPSVHDDPVAAFGHQTEQVQALLDDPERAGATFSSPMTGEQPLGEVLDRFYTTDLFLHRWDLGRAAGLDPALDQEECAAMLAGMSQQEEMIRASGQFGQRQPVSDEAPADEQLMAFLGRDPRWGQDD